MAIIVQMHCVIVSGTAMGNLISHKIKQIVHVYFENTLWR